MRGPFEGNEEKPAADRRLIPGRNRWLPAGCGLAIVLTSSVVNSQELPKPSRRAPHSQLSAVSAPAKPATAVAIPDVAAPVVLPARPLTPEEMPPSPPHIAWDGEQLTIISDNSRLTDILQAVRLATGAEIEIPAGAARDRVAARLGPGPARDVLSTLLSGTDFDYVVQAADSDPLGVQLVILTPRGKSDGAIPGGASSMNAARALNYRLRQGTGRAEALAQEDAAAPEISTSTDTVDPQASPVPVQAAPAETQPGPVEAPSDVRPLVSDIPPTAGQSTQAGLNSSAASGSDSSQPSISSSQDPIQQMQNMFEQRKLMQQEALKGRSGH